MKWGNRKLAGDAFDRAYIEHEGVYHVDEVLIPSATSAELKALLVEVRPAFVAHLPRHEHDCGMLDLAFR